MQTSVFFDGFHFSAIAIGLQEAFQINRQALYPRTIPNEAVAVSGLSHE
jgi:energy-converting hydrogenase Eha subunit F